jgi:putative HNHc nuclease
MVEPFFRTPRIHDPDYLDYIRQQPCVICGDNTTVEAAHVRVGSIGNGKRYTGLGEKSSDKWALPLCGKHHREQHATGNELEFWASYNIDPFATAMTYQVRR